MRRLLAYLLVFLSLVSCSRFNRVQKRGTTEQKYQAAILYFEKKDYYRASVLFEDIIPVLKGTEQSEKANYYYAYSQYYQGNLVLASAYFRRFAETFPRSEYKEDAMYMHARSLFEDIPKYTLDQTNALEAIRSIQNFLNAFPQTKHLEDCNFMMDNISIKQEEKNFHLAKAYYRQRHYKAAMISLGNFLKEFPGSKYNEEVNFMILESKYEYAKNSLEEKKKERYKATIEYYQSFLDQYPSGKYLKKAEEVYDNTLKGLDKHELFMAKNGLH
jgi:outer membrane protein assembly factor BamD